MRNLGLVAPGFVLWQSAALAQTETIATSAAESSAPDNGTTGVVGSNGAPRGAEHPPHRGVLPTPESGSAILNHPTTSTRD